MNDQKNKPVRQVKSKKPAKSKKIINLAQWYIVTCSNGYEDTVIKNLKAKVAAMHFGDLILDAKVIKIRTTIEEEFDSNNPEKVPPKNMRNSVNIKWKTLGKGKYLKVKIVDKNKFPGYIYVKMVMTDDTWYAVRNAPNITGLIGSSGKRTKPIPINFDEEMLLSGETDDPSRRIVVEPNAIIDMDRNLFDEEGKLIGFHAAEDHHDHDFKPDPNKVVNSSKLAVDSVQDDSTNNSLPTLILEELNKSDQRREPLTAEVEVDEISVTNPTVMKLPDETSDHNQKPELDTHSLSHKKDE